MNQLWPAKHPMSLSQIFPQIFPTIISASYPITTIHKHNIPAPHISHFIVYHTRCASSSQCFQSVLLTTVYISRYHVAPINHTPIHLECIQWVNPRAPRTMVKGHHLRSPPRRSWPHPRPVTRSIRPKPPTNNPHLRHLSGHLSLHLHPQ